MEPPWTHARRLLREAAALYDGSEALSGQAAEAGAGAFGGGAAWMALGLAALRGRPPREVPERAWQIWGFGKYGACAAAALVALGLSAWAGAWWLGLPLVVLAFYAVEAQMVFLFPRLLDGAEAPLAEARAMTGRAGGTVRVMLTVLPLAATMLFGGLAGQGVVRSWCLGCAAVLIWYEEVRLATSSVTGSTVNVEGGGR